jgi:hypothetical protein
VRARTQKKSDIICARKCAQRRARESEEEMKKNCFLDTDTKVEDAIFWTNFGLKSEKQQNALCLSDDSVTTTRQKEEKDYTCLCSHHT